MGGFNDNLVQIDKVRNYAREFNRTLILDLNVSGLRMPFENVFVANESIGCQILPWSKQISKEMDGMKSIIPPELVGKLSKYRVIWNHDVDMHTHRYTDVIVDFDYDRDHDAQLLVHQQCGGGETGPDILKDLSFKPSVVDKIAERLVPLGRDYDAIHVRNSDYKTNYIEFFEECRDRFRNRPLLICSDNIEVKNAAHEIFHSSTSLLSVADIPDTKGRPLHFSYHLDPLETAVDLLSDLMALARSQNLIYANLASADWHQISVSGFSQLAQNLKNRPEVIRELFRYISDEHYDALFGHEK